MVEIIHNTKNIGKKSLYLEGVKYYTGHKNCKGYISVMIVNQWRCGGGVFLVFSSSDNSGTKRLDPENWGETVDRTVHKVHRTQCSHPLQ